MKKPDAGKRPNSRKARGKEMLHRGHSQKAIRRAEAETTQKQSPLPNKWRGGEWKIPRAGRGRGEGGGKTVI